MRQQIWKSDSPPSPNFTISVCCYLLSVACLMTYLNFLKFVSFMCGHWNLFHQISGQIVIRQKFPQMCETWKPPSLTDGLYIPLTLNHIVYVSSITFTSCLKGIQKIRAKGLGPSQVFLEYTHNPRLCLLRVPRTMTY